MYYDPSFGDNLLVMYLRMTDNQICFNQINLVTLSMVQTTTCTSNLANQNFISTFASTSPLLSLGIMYTPSSYTSRDAKIISFKYSLDLNANVVLEPIVKLAFLDGSGE